VHHELKNLILNILMPFRFFLFLVISIGSEFGGWQTNFELSDQNSLSQSYSNLSPACL